MQRPINGIENTNWSEEGFHDQTLRQVVRVSAGGTKLRIRLSNAYGTTALRLAEATVTRVNDGAPRRLQFGDVPAGGTAASAPVDLRIEPLDRLTVPLSFTDKTGPATFHSIASATSYRGSSDSSSSWYFLTGVDVGGSVPAVVTLGDSITDGGLSTQDADKRYPDLVAERLVAAGRPMGVLNAGIGGNRVLNDSVCFSVCFGEKATARFRRDMIDQPGVRTAIVLLGINDIGLSVHDFPPCTVPIPRSPPRS